MSDLECGDTGTVPGSVGLVEVILAIGAGVFGALGTAAQFITSGGAVSVVLAGVTAAVVIIVIVWSNVINLAATPSLGRFGCAAGVVNAVLPADTSMFDMHHGRVDLVVKQMYWAELAIGSPPFLWCAGCSHCPSSVLSSPPSDGVDSCSPILRCYYRSTDVIAAAVGTAVGATVGAAVGAVIGIIAGIAVIAAAGCGIAGPFSLFCLALVALVCLVVIAAVAIAAAVGGAAGNAIGAAVGPSDTSPSGQQQGGVNMPITPGTYMSAFGNMLPVLDANAANALWFTGWVPVPDSGVVVDVTQLTGDGTSLLGPTRQVPPVPPFCHTDPDANIQGDPCEQAKSEAAAALATLGF